MVGGGGGERLPVVSGVVVSRALEHVPFRGPLIALARALEVVREPYVLVVAGDMPTLAPAVLAALLRSLDSADGLEATCLLFRSRRQPLPMALRVGAATVAAHATIGRGERSLTALLADLRTRDLDESEWRPFDPTAATLRDVDRPEDLPQ
jgi:molybdopterin-guanine dinucleotide biosynthesis protein A